MYTILVWVKLKTPPKNTKIPPKNTKRAKIKTEFFCFFGIIFVILGGFMYYLRSYLYFGGGGSGAIFVFFCIFWGRF
jgi:hypothetical protein